MSSDSLIEDSHLQHLEVLSDSLLRTELLRCCGSPGWVEAMLDIKPFDSVDNLFNTADHLWSTMPPEEWRTAFAAHPKIGDANALKSKFAKSSWEGEEQKGANEASQETLEQLAALNDVYLQKNGFIFLICATGKSADEMLAALQERLANDTDTELRNAAAEQGKITKLRLMKLINSIKQNKKDINARL